MTSEAQTDPKVDSGNPKAFHGRITKTKAKRREYLRDWQVSVDMRRMKATPTDDDENRIPVPMDWSITNTKIAALFSQVPKVIATGEGPYKPAGAVFQKKLNERLTKAGVGAVMDEVLPDVINAAGVGVAHVYYESLTEMRDIPKNDPPSLADQAKMLVGMRPEMVSKPFPVDKRFVIDRVSPGDFLWPLEFVRSDFDLAPWLGHSGRKTWNESLVVFKPGNGNRGLAEQDKVKVLGDQRTQMDKLTTDGEGETTNTDEDVVCYDEVFYKRYLYHKGEKSFSALQRLVFVEGIEEPVINEPYSGQRYDEETKRYIGVCRYPIQVLTLHYLSDEAIPPSMSAVIRTQVLELMRTRYQIMSQRDHNKPIRWYDVNRIDADIQTLLMMGDWNGFIPTQGMGDKAIGEVARSNYPKEDLGFDELFKRDMMEAAGLGPNQMGGRGPSGFTKGEAEIINGYFTTQQAQERARGVKFFLGIADVMAGLMSLYDDFELPNPADGERLASWDRTRIKHELAFSIRGDSTVLLDAQQRLERGIRLLNMIGKSQNVNPKPILEELVALSGFDPDEVIVNPPPRGPEPPSVSFRFSGSEDLRDPMAVAMLMKSEQAPTPEELQAAIALIASAGPVVKTTLGSKEDIIETTMHQPGAPPAPPQGAEGMPPMDTGMQDDRPEWQSIDRINSRRDASQN